MLHSPRLLLLDGPALGVDFAGKRRIRQFLAELKKTGVTVFLATHDLAGVEPTCDRRAMVRQGRNSRLTFSRVRRICIPAMRQGIIRLSCFIPLAGPGGKSQL